ncbi:iron chaperone [Demequina sp. NBRC 110056]|uniref:iron chaperone n=1 Tax=Demequina sp. NBRC 110056 TaxID=1570345 RepID=UPI000A01EACF|nr:DUF1801 domain-containing protein [Demequina sp. NBRC 110056]
MSEPTTHDEYIDAAPERFRPLLRDLRAAISAAAPDATEVIAYGMPGFRLGGATLAGYSAFSKQCGLYLPAEAISECADALAGAGLKHTKTGVTFTAARPIPAEVLAALLDAARRSIEP